MNSQTQSKRKYNKNSYRRYEFSVNLDTELNARLESMKAKEESISLLIKELLCEHFNIAMNQPHTYSPEETEKIMQQLK